MDRRIYENPHRTFNRGAPITIEFEGASYRAYEGEPLAVALFASGVNVLSRSIKYHRPRAFFCLEGHCGACLMRIDDLPNQRACLAPSRDGLRCQGQNAYPASDLDVLGAVDWFFPRGMDHHTLMTGSKLLNRVMQKVVRQLSGLGHKPERVSEAPEVESREVDVVVVGGGPAGLAAATAAAEAGAETLLVDEQDRAGGSLLSDPGHGPEGAGERAAQARAAGVELREGSGAIAWFPEDDGGLLGVASAERFTRVKPRVTVYATGAYDQNALFEDNDRPGIFSGRAVGRLAVRHGVRPGDRVVVLGDTPYARALHEELVALGVDATHVDGVRERVVRARGHNWVSAVEVEAGGRRRTLECDCLAVAVVPAPASDLPRQHGCRVALHANKGGFAVVVDGDGRTTVPGVFACGDVTGYMGPDEAARHGAHVGAVAAREARQ